MLPQYFEDHLSSSRVLDFVSFHHQPTARPPLLVKLRRQEISSEMDRQSRGRSSSRGRGCRSQPGGQGLGSGDEEVSSRRSGDLPEL